MRAIRFKIFGDPSVLELTEAATPAADERTAIVRVLAASINPSDVKNVAGAMKQTTLPGSPGRDLLAWSKRVRPNGLGPKFGVQAAIPGLPATAPMQS